MSLRVDALVVAFKLELIPAVGDELLERQAIADLAGHAELRIGDSMFAMKRGRRIDFSAFENADLRAVFDRRAAGGWQLEIVVRAVYLATHSLSEALGLGFRVADGCGTVQGTRLRRFDLAADYVGFPIARDDIDRIVTTRARVDNFLAEGKDVDEVSGEFCKPPFREHRSAALNVTGITVAPGNPLMARVYDKTTELTLAGREDKRAIEHERWRRGGWDGNARVTRVEFQHRGSILDEIALRDPSALEGNLDAVWQHDVRWLRLVDAGSATRRSRAPLDPRWVAVQATRFRHQAAPVQRVRNRGGAKPEHVHGTVVSRLASTGRIPRIDLGVNDDGEPLDERAFVDARTDDECAHLVRRGVEHQFTMASQDVSQSLLDRYGPRTAALRFVAKNNAAIARFSSDDDRSRSERQPRAGKPRS